MKLFERARHLFCRAMGIGVYDEWNEIIREKQREADREQRLMLERIERQTLDMWGPEHQIKGVLGFQNDRHNWSDPIFLNEIYANTPRNYGQSNLSNTYYPKPKPPPQWRRNFDLTPEQRSARTAKGNRTRALRRKDGAT